jgi:hypothetical protein
VALLTALSLIQPGWGLAATAALILVLGLLVGSRAGERAMARLRRLANVVELVAVVSLVPLVLGVFGVFADLLGKF